MPREIILELRFLPSCCSAISLDIAFISVWSKLGDGQNSGLRWQRKEGSRSSWEYEVREKVYPVLLPTSCG